MAEMPNLYFKGAIMMDEFNNRIEGNTTVGFKSRVVASFINVGGKVRSKKFDEYLDKLVELHWIEAKDKDEIRYFAMNGKLELESIARIIINDET